MARDGQGRLRCFLVALYWVFPRCACTFPYTLYLGFEGTLHCFMAKMPWFFLLSIIVALACTLGVQAGSGNFVSIPLEKVIHQPPSFIPSAAVSETIALNQTMNLSRK